MQNDDKFSKSVSAARKAKQIADQAVALAEFAARAYIAADERNIKTRTVEPLPLADAERATLAALPALPTNLKKKLAKKNAAFTIVDVATFVMSISESFVDASPSKQMSLLTMSRKLMDCLHDAIIVPKSKAGLKLTDAVFQFKITLIKVKSPIWRRIQVKDCTLDNLHEYIQTSMGWTNLHLHHFKVGDQLYGDPDLMEEDFEELGYKDSTSTKLSDMLPKSGKRLRFIYVYDFGDKWEHEVLFEGIPPVDPNVKYPLCLEGERACPPEDCGGVSGYAKFLEIIQDKSRHKKRAAMFEWASGWFDPEEFDATTATKSMKKGLPDWRTMA